MSQYYTTSAFTLARQPRGEFDRVYTLYTKALGKVEAVAEGSQRITSKLAGHLEPFGEVMVTLVQRGSVTKVSGALTRRRWQQLAGDLTSLQAAARCLRLTVWGVGPAPDPACFALLQQALAVIDGNRGPAAGVVAEAYALQLYTRLGFQPKLNRCGRCHRESAITAFDPSGGCVVCYACAQHGGADLATLRPEVHQQLSQLASAPLDECARHAPDAATLAEVANVVDRFVSYRVETSRVG